MKTIMFADCCGLTMAVVGRRKNKTRREESALKKAVEKYEATYNAPFCFISQYYDYGLERLVLRTPNEPIYLKPRFLPGEVVAVAQKYKDFRWPAPQRSDFQEIIHSAGWNNKMYVRADLMPHRIRITNVKVERLQDISEEDCLREGILTLTSESNPTHYTFDGWRFKNKVFRCSDTPREAFAALIDRTSGKGTWENNAWVVAYEFELVK